ncbi:ATP-dependent DNA ligase [Micromonospora sp. NPDC049679]|uniref:ATP-dependent DNA ligase n=1 Tax=Micromonospora sp. NPDC049679 TaxID=3155920 RepID=UPI003405C086
MLAKPVDALPRGAGCVFEPKFDGFRAVVFRQPEQIFVQSRAGRPLHGYFPDIVRVVRTAMPPGVVLDGELIIWAGDRTDFGLLQRRLGAGSTVGRLARQHPAHLVVFDLLQGSDGAPLLNRPLAERRRALTELLTDPPPELVLCPQTTDREEAAEWLRGWHAAGVEGVVAKGASGRYLPGRRGWLKYRHRTTTEAIIGGVTGQLGQPETLLLGRYDAQGRLRYTGRSHPLRAAQRRELIPLLLPGAAQTTGHPWPQPLPAAWSGQLPHPEPLPYHQVPPVLVAEISVDTAFEQHRWRHRVHHLRIRMDLGVDDVPPLAG